jgi:hypothetical protein
LNADQPKAPGVINGRQADIAMSSTRYVCEIHVSDGGSCDIGSGWTAGVTSSREQ